MVSQSTMHQGYRFWSDCDVTGGTTTSKAPPVSKQVLGYERLARRFALFSLNNVWDTPPTGINVDWTLVPWTKPAGVTSVEQPFTPPPPSEVRMQYKSGGWDWNAIIKDHGCWRLTSDDVMDANRVTATDWQDALRKMAQADRLLVGVTTGSFLVLYPGGSRSCPGLHGSPRTPA